MYKTETANRAETAINKYYVIFEISNFKILSNLTILRKFVIEECLAVSSS